MYSASSTQESSSKMAQNKKTFRDEGGSSSSQLSCLTVHSVVSKEVSFPIYILSAAHLFKTSRFSVQDLEYICVLINELPKLFSCLCPLLTHSQQ